MVLLVVCTIKTLLKLNLTLIIVLLKLNLSLIKVITIVMALRYTTIQILIMK